MSVGDPAARGNFHSSPHTTIDTSGVESLLIKHDPHEATGPDTIPGHLLCELSAEVAPAQEFFSNVIGHWSESSL